MEKTEWTFEALPCTNMPDGTVIRPFAIDGKIIFKYNINPVVEGTDNVQQAIELCQAIYEVTHVAIKPEQIVKMVINKKITIKDDIDAKKD